MFDPKPHLIQLPKRVKDRQTGHYTTVYDDYLEVKWRLVWFREKFPRGSIDTQELCVDLDRGYARYRAVVSDGEGGKATGTGTETAAGFADYVEKAETRAVGRALAALGIGTQFVGEELSEGDHVADAPVTKAGIPINTTSAVSNGRPLETAPHPTVEEIDRLFTLAESCQEPKEVFGTQLRRIMALDGSVRISKKFLRESMTMRQFDAAIAYYTKLLRQQVEEDVPDGTPAQDAAVPESAHPPTEETPPAGPFVEEPTAAGGPGQPAQPPAPGVATPQQVAALQRLAAQGGPEAAADLQDVLAHAPNGLVPDLYRRIEARLQARLPEQQAAAVA